MQESKIIIQSALYLSKAFSGRLSRESITPGVVEFYKELC